MSIRRYASAFIYVDLKKLLREISEATEDVINECVDIATETGK